MTFSNHDSMLLRRLAIALSGALLAGAAQGAPLLLATATQGTIDTSELPALRVRYVQVDFPLLESGPASLNLDLFPDVAVTATVTESGIKAGGSVLWRGVVTGSPGSLVTFVAREGFLSATVHLGSSSYEVLYAGNGVHAVYEVDPSVTAADQGVGEQGQGTGAGLAPSAPVPGGDDGSQFDLMVIYTRQLRDFLGGTDAAIARAEQLVAGANAALERSDAAPRWRLIHVGEHPDDETPGGSAPSFDEEIVALRNAYKADRVGMITNWAHGGFTGYSSGQWFWAYNFSSLIFAHEAGHSMGCEHARGDPYTTNNPNRYNYGYRFNVGPLTYRTIMAYSPGIWIAHYSNPDVLFQGVPTGIAHPSPNNDSADCARAIDTYAPLTATWQLSDPLKPGDIIVVNSELFGNGGSVAWLDPFSLDQVTITDSNPFSAPIGVAIDGTQTIFVVDAGYGALPGSVFEVDPLTGGISVLTTGGFLSSPENLTVERNGDIVVTDHTTLRVVRVDRDTGAQSLLSSGGLLTDPRGIVATPDGRLYVTDGGEILRIDPVTGAQSVVSQGGLLSGHRSIDYDRDGNLVLGYSSLPVVRVDPATGAQTQIAPAGSFALRDLAVEDNGDVLVADNFNVLRIDGETGIPTTLYSPVVTFPSAVAVARPDLPDCMDGFDNDGDGFVDDPADPGCEGPSDPAETTACDDGLDNDSDGLTDFPSDPGCRDPNWVLENPQCQDGINNDGQYGIDFDGGASAGNPTGVADPECTSSWKDKEKKPSCGLGFEIVLLLPPVMWLRSRRPPIGRPALDRSSA